MVDLSLKYTYIVWVPIIEDYIMFLPEYNVTQVQREATLVFKAALKEPIIITRQASEGFVMMSKKEYAKLVKAAEK